MQKYFLWSSDRKITQITKRKIVSTQVKLLYGKHLWVMEKNYPKTLFKNIYTGRTFAHNTIIY